MINEYRAGKYIRSCIINLFIVMYLIVSVIVGVAAYEKSGSILVAIGAGVAWVWMFAVMMAEYVTGLL